MAEQNGVLGSLVFFLFLALVVWGLRHVFDSTGYVSHDVHSTITAQSDWMVGESKDCMSFPLDADTARAQGKQAGYAFSYVNCDNGPEHNITITFWGAEYQPGKTEAEWNCKRTSDSFVCKQTGAN